MTEPPQGTDRRAEDGPRDRIEALDRAYRDAIHRMEERNKRTARGVVVAIVLLTIGVVSAFVAIQDQRFDQTVGACERANEQNRGMRAAIALVGLPDPPRSDVIAQFPIEPDCVEYARDRVTEVIG